MAARRIVHGVHPRQAAMTSPHRRRIRLSLPRAPSASPRPGMERCLTTGLLPSSFGIDEAYAGAGVSATIGALASIRAKGEMAA